MSTGDGGGFSTAWNNSVRSRLFLRRPITEDKEAAKDKRVLEVKKANYGPDGTVIPLVFHAGCFVPDDEPIDENRSAKAPRVDTALAIAVMQLFNTDGADGKVLSFARIFEYLQKTGAVEKGHYESIRKRVSRALRGLCDANLLRPCEVPRGSYRLSQGGSHA